MKISNQTKAILFSNYLDQEVYVSNPEVNTKNERVTGYKISCIYNAGVPSKCILKLKPLSALKDEDAIEVAKCYYSDSYYHKPEFGNALVKLVFILNSTSSMVPFTVLRIFQMLTHRGYDFPQVLLEGQTMEQAGLATY